MEAQSAHPLHVEVEEETRPERRRTLRAWGGREHDRAAHKGSSVIGPIVCSRRRRSLARAKSVPSKTIMQSLSSSSRGLHSPEFPAGRLLPKSPPFGPAMASTAPDTALGGSTICPIVHPAQQVSVEPKRGLPIGPLAKQPTRKSTEHRKPPGNRGPGVLDE